MLIKLYKFGVYCNNKKMFWISRLIFKIQFLLFNTTLPHSAVLGENTRFAYGGIGCVVHSRAILGKNCVIGQCSTIGGRSKHHEVPILGDNVYIGAGARVIGPIKIGSNSIIAPNAVVIDDVEANTIVGGIPAKILRSNIEPADYI